MELNSIYNEDKTVSENQPISRVNSLENNDQEPLYIMNLELENESVELKIYENSDPSELASAFCQLNKLDYESYEYLKEEISGLLTAYREKLANENFSKMEYDKLKIDNYNSNQLNASVKPSTGNKGSNIYANENKNNFDIIYEEDDLFKGESKDNLNETDLHKINIENVKNLKNYDEKEPSLKEYIKDQISQSSKFGNISLEQESKNSNKSIKDGLKIEEICENKFINHIMTTNNSNKIEKDISEILSKTNLDNLQNNNQINDSIDKKSTKFKEKIKEISKQTDDKAKLFPYQQYVKEYNHHIKISEGSSVNDRLEFKNSSTFKNPFSITNKSQRTSVDKNINKSKIKSLSSSVKSLSKSKSKSKKSINNEKRDVFKELYDEARIKKIKHNFENNSKIQIINNNYNININNFKNNFQVQPLSKSSQKSGVDMYEKRVSERDEQNYKLHILRKEKEQKLMSECSFSPKISEYKNIKSNINDLSSVEIKRKKREDELKKIKEKIQTDDHEYTFKPVINRTKNKSNPRVYNIQYDYSRKHENQIKVINERKMNEYFKPRTLEETNKKILQNSKIYKIKQGSSKINSEEMEYKENEETKFNFINRLELYQEIKDNNLKRICKESIEKPRFHINNTSSESLIKTDYVKHSDNSSVNQDVFTKNYNYFNKYQEKKEDLKNKFEENNSNFHSSQTSNILFEQKKISMYKKLFKVLDFDNDNLITKYSVNFYSLSPNLKRILHDLIKELKDQDETLTSEEFVQAMTRVNNLLNYSDKNVLFNELQNLDTCKNSFYKNFIYQKEQNDEKKNLNKKSTTFKPSKNIINQSTNLLSNPTILNKELRNTFYSARMMTSEKLSETKKMKETAKKSTQEYSFKPSINKNSKIIDSKIRKLVLY